MVKGAEANSQDDSGWQVAVGHELFLESGQAVEGSLALEPLPQTLVEIRHVEVTVAQVLKDVLEQLAIAVDENAPVSPPLEFVPPAEHGREH